MSWVIYVCTYSLPISRAADSPKLDAGRRAWWRQRSRDTGCGHHRVDVDCRWRWRRALDGWGCCSVRRGCRFWRHRDPTLPMWPTPSDLRDTSAESKFPRRPHCSDRFCWNLRHCRHALIRSYTKGAIAVMTFEVECRFPLGYRGASPDLKVGWGKVESKLERWMWGGIFLTY